MMSIAPKFALSIIIPVFNEAESVVALYLEIKMIMEQTTYQYEIIFIDDGSTDGTEIRLQALTGTEQQLKIISHKKNHGQSIALVTGVKAARYDMLIVMDGDGQNDPADIPLLLASYDTQHTVILGNRKKRNDNKLRKLSSWIANGIRQRVLKDNCGDSGCSLKLFSREAFLALPHFNHLHRFLPALFKRAGLKIINIPVNHRPRMHGISKYGLFDRLFIGIHDLIGVHWLLKRPCAPEIYDHEQ